MNDPLEQIVAEALEGADMDYLTGEGGGNPSGLDFNLVNHGVEIEVKRFHSARISDQMSRAENVIAIQGEGAVRFFANLIRAKSFRDYAESRALDI